MFIHALVIALVPPCLDESDGRKPSICALDGGPEFAVLEVLDSGARIWLLSGVEGVPALVVRADPAIRDCRWSLASAGDLDLDGHCDLLVGAHPHAPNEYQRSPAGDYAPFPEYETGVVFAYSGKDGALLYELESGDTGDRFGFAVAGGQDMTGDGRCDIVVGAPGYQPYPMWEAHHSNIGLVYVFSGEDGSLERVLGVDGEGARSWPAGAVPSRREIAKVLGGKSALGLAAGVAVTVLPDMDGDGRAEVGFSAPEIPEDGELPYRGGWHGSVRVVNGGVWNQILRVDTGSYESMAGAWRLAGLRDVDGDACPDIAYTVIHKTLAVVSGRTGEVLFERDYSGGFLSAEGTSLDVVPDSDGDGICEILVGANETGLDCDRGRVAVWSPAKGERLLVYEPTGSYRVGDMACSYGADGCSLGDVDGDGSNEVAVWVPGKREVIILGIDSGEPMRRIDLSALDTGQDDR